ncbi:MAG: protein-L-isoaspartate(D-aspartate) O-methyltransferase [Pirellulales bacterium]
MDGPTDTARHRMVVDQIERRGIRSPRVLSAIEKVPRDLFLPSDSRPVAYTDRALPIACEQTISQPYIVALMTNALDLTGSEHVLEIGTGSGYQAAILAELADNIVTVERHEELLRAAAETLTSLGYTNIRCEVGDGTLGWPEAAPYDRIIVTATAQRCPPALWGQLTEGGVLVMPIGDVDSQVLWRLEKRDGEAIGTHLTGCRFVPLIGQQGWPE